MTPTFVGSIYPFGGNFAILDFALCQGQSQSIAENSTLYALLGTIYGGDGQTTFNLPDLRGRVPIGQGVAPGLATYVIGQTGGNETATLNTNTMPSHSHLINASTNAGTTATPLANANFAAAPYTGPTADVMFNTTVTGLTPMNNATIGNSGSSLPIEILSPILAMSYVIALYGIYPTRS